MKKILLSLIILLSAIMLISCSDEYKPVKSTKDELRTMLTFEIDGEKYEVKYELYRMLFLNNKSSVDGGDNSVWSGENASEYISKINEIIIERASEIYSVLHFAEKLGIDPYSKEINNKIKEYVKIGVEGNGGDIIGHGTYDKYLASLKERNLNYSVHELLFRYSIVLEKIDEYYKGTTDAVLGQLPGDFTVSRENVKNYYESADCARIFHLYYTEEQVCEDMAVYKAGLENASSDLEAALYIINNMPHIVYSDLILEQPPNAIGGIVLGRYSLDAYTYRDYIDAAFSLHAGEVSDIIDINDGIKTEYIVYKLDKSETHFNNCYEVIKNSYIDNEIGKNIHNIKASIESSVRFESKYNEISHKDISMD